jgi:beta-glucosidase
VLIAREAGAYTFSLTSAGRSRLFARGELLLDAWTRRERGQSFFGAGSKEVTAQVELAAGESLPIAIEYSREGAPALGGLRVGCLAPEPSDLMERAVAAAAACDAAVVVVGLDEEWETEGRDRASLALPGRQAELIERVAAANPRCVVVVNAGAPVEAEWCERVPAVLALWYPGQEGGHALADVLFGAADPGGRLPQTWPARLEDTPAYTSYPGECGVVHYGEGLFAGYRWYDARKTEPRFAFGHGLSYARFEYGELRVDPSRFPVVAEVDVTNAGSRAGREVVQLYRSDVAPRLARPPQELVAFEKLSLAPGETRRVRFELDERAFACWDASTHAWAVEPGERELAAARSSRDVRARARFKIS